MNTCPTEDGTLQGEPKVSAEEVYLINLMMIKKQKFSLMCGGSLYILDIFIFILPKKRYSYRKKLNISPYLAPCTKIKVKWIIGLSVKSKTIKLQHESRRKFCKLGVASFLRPPHPPKKKPGS